MHTFINSCPFDKLFAYMNHSSLVTVHLIVGDLRYITVLWCSHHRPRPRPNIIAQEGPIAQGCVSWLWYKHDQLLVAIVECGGRAKSGPILPVTKVEAGEIEIIATMRTFTEKLFSTSPHPSPSPSKHQQSRQGKQAQFLFRVIL